ncbi:MAG: OsmC family protein [Candidatus Bathyarchaeota archaeon]|nr:OsmC family protein [Candidatus Bathyarchaeota archaeon]
MSETNLTKLKLIQGYKFKAEFDAEGMPDLIVDEQKPLGENSGPNPTRLLSAAVGHCLSSSLLFCLSKARVNVKNLETTINATKERNEEGRMRIRKLEVEMHLDVDEKDRNRVARCISIFENYCTVTQSVRKGIEVTVNVK